MCVSPRVTTPGTLHVGMRCSRHLPANQRLSPGQVVLLLRGDWLSLPPTVDDILMRKQGGHLVEGTGSRVSVSNGEY